MTQFLQREPPFYMKALHTVLRGDELGRMMDDERARSGLDHITGFAQGQGIETEFTEAEDRGVVVYRSGWDMYCDVEGKPHPLDPLGDDRKDALKRTMYAISE